MFLPANTPEFSPIENMFGCIKRILKDFEFKHDVKAKNKPKELAKKVASTAYSLEKRYFEGFYKKSLQNMCEFWSNLDRQKFIAEVN